MASLDFATAMVLVLLAVGAVAWSSGIVHRILDYDELVHAREAWLIRSGLTPFRDFFECHPPFAWYPLSLFFRVFGDSYNLLFVFRFLTAIGQIVFLAALLKNVALSLRELPTPVRLPFWVGALAAAFIVLFQPVMDLLVEFRLDAWPNALQMIAIYRYRTRRTNAFRSSVELAALSTVAILCSPKLVLFIALFALASLAVDDRRLERVAGMFAGGVGVVALAAGFLKLVGLNPVHAFKLALQYHHMLNEKGGFGRGVYEIVWAQTIVRNVVIASAIAWPLVSWRRIHRASFEIALLLFLVLQLRFVGFGYKQYYAPWFLLAVGFLPYLEVLARRVRPLRSLLLAAAVLFIADNVLPMYRGYKDGAALTADIQARKEREALVRPGHFVMSSIELMPLFRRDSVYQHHNSYAPSGYDGTRIMQELKLEPYSSEFTTEKALKEIEARPPDLIITSSRFPGYVQAALDKYLVTHKKEYRTQDSPVGPYLVRKR